MQASTRKDKIRLLQGILSGSVPVTQLVPDYSIECTGKGPDGWIAGYFINKVEVTKNKFEDGLIQHRESLLKSDPFILTAFANI